MRNFKAALVLAIVVLASAVPVATAAVWQDPPPASSTYPKGACFYEHSNGGGDVAICASNGSNWSNLNGNPLINSTTKTCGGQYIRLSRDYNDCISSIRVWLDPGYRLCIFRDSGFNYLLTSYTSANNGSYINLTGSYNDSITSWGFVYGGASVCSNL